MNVRKITATELKELKQSMSENINIKLVAVALQHYHERARVK